MVPVVNNLPTNAREARDVGLIPGLGRSPAGGKWQPTPLFLTGEPHRGAWRVTVYGITKSHTRLSD